VTLVEADKEGHALKRKISRRSFLRRSSGICAASLIGGRVLSELALGDDQPPAPEEHPDDTRSRKTAGPTPDIAVVQGKDRRGQTIEAIRLLGGMERFVPRGSKVCLLPNAQRSNPGTFTKPEIVRAVAGMCREAGAGEVSCLSWLPRASWTSTALDKALEESGARLRIVDRTDESLFRSVPVPRGKILKQARVMELFYEYDVLINMPITKDHAGNRFTGTLKNLMGLSSPKTNRTFHTGNFKNDDIGHLDQCIADLNTIIQPTLCVVDATEFIITNGPFGPGDLHRPQKVVAGIDRVAIDAYCATLWGLDPASIIMIDRAERHGLGRRNLQEVALREAAI
jgi:uncharacterized protein (DUF362 family)